MAAVSEYHPSEIPAKPGVYVFRDRFGTVIYVGKARNLRKRLANYFQPARLKQADKKLASLINSIADWNIQVVRNEDEALILESQLIKTYAPHYNILMRDDKRYLLLKIDWAQEYPTLSLARLKKPGNIQYFGPFPQGNALKATLEFLLAHFGLRACRDSHPNLETRKHCLKRIVKDCCAPCTGEVTKEEYLAKLNLALKVLEGDLKSIRASITEKMTQAALEQKFEKAASLRDILSNIEAVFGKKTRVFEHVELPGGQSPGMVAVNALAERLNLTTLPRKIIGFDISNILGTFAVASLISFSDGKPDRDNYKRFKIKTVHQSNDFAMMEEVITRHFSRLLKENKPMPDLLMVDGGKGQLSSALKVLNKLNCYTFPVIGLAEKNEEIYLPNQDKALVLDRHDPALKMLQALRDETHRFAITYHRNLRQKAIEHSLLDDIPGIGKTRKMQLLKEFGSLAQLRKVSALEICEKIPNIGESLANKIVEYINK